MKDEEKKKGKGAWGSRGEIEGDDDEQSRRKRENRGGEERGVNEIEL